MPTIDEELLHDLMVTATSDIHAPAGACARVTRERRRSRQTRRRVIATTATALTTAAAAIPVASVASAPTTASHGRTAAAATKVPTRTSSTTTAHAKVAEESPLVRLADYVAHSAAPAGNATLVARTTGGVTVYDLYADNGEYFFSTTESGLAGQVSGGHSQANGLFAREVKAAKLAASGNVEAGAQDMADAPDPSKIIPRHEKIDWAAVEEKEKLTGQKMTPGSLFDNWAWENSEDALIAGAGQPDVRAGVLRIIATLGGITVTSGTSDGQATQILTSGVQELGNDYVEQDTLNATTGIPLSIAGGTPGHTLGVTTYQVSRVTLKDVAVGKF